MTTGRDEVAEVLAPVLSAFHSIGEEPLQAVWWFCRDGSTSELVLDFGAVSLVVIADENDDSIGIAGAETVTLCNAGRTCGSHLEPWSRLIGKPFGWGWVTVNQQGYCDGLLLSFGGIVPQVSLNVVASSIKVATVAQCA